MEKNQFKPSCNTEVYKIVAEKYNLTEKEAKQIIESQFEAIAFSLRGRVVGRFLISKIGSLQFDMNMWQRHKQIEDNKQK